MKKWAFILLASVITSQILLLGGVIIGCFTIYPKIAKDYHHDDPSDPRCSGQKVSEMLTMIVSQSFALYAAEK